MNNTFEIYINNVPCKVDTSMRLPEVLTLFDVFQPYALMVNHAFLPHSKHNTVELKPNDHIEVISAIQGG
jgi:thiamine biosynthesis protein ThiS